MYDQAERNVLMCYRTKNPYKGLYNLVGGKVELDEDDLSAAYRELQEETGITNKDIILKHVMNFIYPLTNIELQVYAGILNKDVILVEEINKLYWFDVNTNFFDMTKFAGEGNIGHIMEIIKISHDELLKK